MIKVSDFIFRYLADYGVKHVFMLTGGGAMHLNDSVGRERRIQYICNHHEQACAIAAEGYARACGKIGVVVVTSGPGGTNTLTGVIGQWLDSIPCLYISGQVKQETTINACPELKLRQLGDQEINIVDIVRPVTKYAALVTKPAAIKHHLEKAIYLATYGRPGPVWLDIPMDVQAAVIDELKLEAYDAREDRIECNHDSIKKQVSELADKIKTSKRPVILAGHGIRLADGVKHLHQLIAKLQIPVLTSICGHDLIWSDHPQFMGRPGICGDRAGNFILQNSDLMIAIGARLGIRQISYNYSAFARDAYRVMVDIDEGELNKPTLNLHMKVHADAKTFLELLLQELQDGAAEPKNDWLSWCNDVKKDLPSILQDNQSNNECVNSYKLADVLFDQLKDGDLVVTGNGTAYTGTFQIMHLKKGVRVFTNQGCAAMGYDLPAAIGACFAKDKQQVILLTGDGSIQMNIQELQTIFAHKLPIKIFMLNNNGYLAIRATQDAYFEGRHVGESPQSGVTCPDICRVARAYGIKSYRITNEKGLPQKIRKVLSLSEPVICDVHMDQKQTLYPKLSSVVKPDGRMVSKPLEDMYPFIARDDFFKHMIIKPLDED